MLYLLLPMKKRFSVLILLSSALSKCDFRIDNLNYIEEKNSSEKLKNRLELMYVFMLTT